MAMTFVDRMLTIVVTATLTSAVWIVAGGSLIEYTGTTASTDESARDAASLPTAAGGEATEQAARPTSPRIAASAGERDLIVPVLDVSASELSDSFTDERGEGARLHEAIDIMAPRGTTVIAAAPGTVEKLFRSDAGGNTIYVRSGDRNRLYYYAHLDEYARGLQEGQRIRRGQRLGTVGSSGNASDEAPHLHFAILRTTADAEWWEPANAINPFPVLTGKAR